MTATGRRLHDAPPEEEPEQGYAGLVTRIIAFAIDAALIDLVAISVGVVVTLVFSVLPESDQVRSATVIAGGALFFIWVIVYFVGFWTTTGQTPGNRAMHIRVTRADRQTLRPRHALLRLVGIVLAAVPLFAGFVPILLTERRRGLHDFLANSVVLAQGQ